MQLETNNLLVQVDAAAIEVAKGILVCRPLHWRPHVHKAETAALRLSFRDTISLVENSPKLLLKIWPIVRVPNSKSITFVPVSRLSAPLV
jgi:hypothetical protein